MLKKYQPERLDLLINTDWGIPSGELSSDTAGSSGLKLFHGRWVTRTERKQLREEFHTYHSILITGYALILAVFIISYPLMLLIFTALTNLDSISPKDLVAALLMTLYGVTMLKSGVGLIKFRRPTRNIAISVFLSFLVLPFTPLLENEKGAPLLIIFGITGLYYLLRKTARKIFKSQFNDTMGESKKNRSIARKIIFGSLLFVGLFAGYFAYDMMQAKQMAADACRRAVPGLALKDYLTQLPEKDYAIIKGSDYITVVPKKGLGRSHCIVNHDGQKILGSNTGMKD